MLRIRPATVEDEKVYQRHWEDVEHQYQWLWYNVQSSDKIFKRVQEKFCDMESIEEMIEREREIIFSDFGKTLQRDRIFIIELDGNIIGSIRFLDYCKGNWRIADWAMEINDDYLKKMVIQEFAYLKLPRAKKISICTINKPTIEFLLDNGFEESPGHFYYFSLSKKRSG